MAIQGFPVSSKSIALMPFRMYCQTILPAVYDDSLSYYEAVCKLVDKINEVIEQYNSQIEGVEALQAAVEELQGELQAFKEHGFDDYYKEQVMAWIDSHLDDIYRYTIKQIYFGLNMEGYFVAYIPESWTDIIFDTGYDYSIDTYGRLILRWDADSPYTVNQTRESR